MIAFCGAEGRGAGEEQEGGEHSNPTPQTDTQTHTQTHRHTDTHRHTQTHTHTDTRQTHKTQDTQSVAMDAPLANGCQLQNALCRLLSVRIACTRHAVEIRVKRCVLALDLLRGRASAVKEGQREFEKMVHLSVLWGGGRAKWSARAKLPHGQSRLVSTWQAGCLALPPGPQLQHRTVARAQNL